MAPESQPRHEAAPVRVDCEGCGQALPPRTRPGGNPKRFCSDKCRDRSQARKRRQANPDARSDASGLASRRKRRPLPDVAKDAAWSLRRDVERIERVFADDRFGSQKEEVTALLRGHLSYAAEVCQDLLGRINQTQGE